MTLPDLFRLLPPWLRSLVFRPAARWQGLQARASGPALSLWRVEVDLLDTEGDLLHPIGSTVVATTLARYPVFADGGREFAWAPRWRRGPLWPAEVS